MSGNPKMHSKINSNREFFRKPSVSKHIQKQTLHSTIRNILLFFLDILSEFKILIMYDN